MSFNQHNTTLLLPVYQRAVKRIGEQGQLRQAIQPDVCLAQHVMVYYWIGKLEFGGADGLIDDFYARASDDLRGHTSRFVGTSIPRWGDQVTESSVVRHNATGGLTPINKTLDSESGQPYAVCRPELASYTSRFAARKSGCLAGARSKP